MIVNFASAGAFVVFHNTHEHSPQKKISKTGPWPLSKENVFGVPWTSKSEELTEMLVLKREPVIRLQFVQWHRTYSWLAWM